MKVKNKKAKIKSINSFSLTVQGLKLAFFAFSLFPFAFASAIAQTTEPKPSAPKTVKIPAVKESTLKNGLKVAVIETNNVPLVTVELLVKSGASGEGMAKAGLANLTADLLTKGTKTRSATDIAEQMEFLGGSINTGAGWNSSVVTVNVMSDKLDQALAIMSDVVLNPTFTQKELDLLKSQTLDGLTYNLTQPGFLTSYVASVYSYGEHPAGGTPASINAVMRDDIAGFHNSYFTPNNSVLIFTGDISQADAVKLTNKYFAKWKSKKLPPNKAWIEEKEEMSDKTVKRILVVDLPNSGQASVGFSRKLRVGRAAFENGKRIDSKTYFPSIVLNSVLGGGYSSRLNQEIRIKRGLSYGAGSSFTFRYGFSNFGTRTQTKNESAAEVAELVLDEIKKLEDGKVAKDELDPRKLVLTGSFGRNLETTGGLAAAIADLYSYDLPTTNLNSYMTSVQGVTDAQIQDFAGKNLNGGDIIIVGDYAKFKDDLTKRFPGMKIQVVTADQLDITKANLQK